MKQQRKVAWLLAICMFFNVLVGIVPNNILHAKTESLPVTIDADFGDWESLVANGQAKKLGEGGPGFAGTTTGALYLANDNEYLYYYVEAELPNWEEDGVYMDLALHVEGQDGGMISNPWERKFDYEMSHLPQYHIINKVSYENGTYNELYSKGTKKEGKSESAADIQRGYEGKVKLDALGVQNGDIIYPIVTLSGNSNDHGALNAIPEDVNNTLMKDWENVPNSQATYAESYTLVMDKITGLEKPEYVSPEVNGNEVTFRYYTDPNPSRVRVAGSFNGWGNRTDEMVLNKATGIWEITLILEPGVHQYKFIENDSDWLTDPVNPNTQDGNSVVVVQGAPKDYVSPEVNEDMVTFRYKTANTPTRVRVAGDFNGWENSKDEMTKNPENDLWEVTFKIPSGRYGYKFIEDDNGWTIDPANPPSNPNGNSILIVSGIVQPNILLEKGKKIEIPSKGTVFDHKRDEHSNVPLTYTEVSDGLSVASEGDKQYITVPQDFTKQSVTFKVEAIIDDITYKAEWPVNVKEKLYTYTINYYRPSADYTDWNLWLWPENGDGASYGFDKEGEHTLGDGKAYTFKQYSHTVDKNKLNMIVRKGEWVDRDGGDRFIEMPQGQEKVEVWMIQGDKNVYYHLDDIDLSGRVKSVFADSATEIIVSLSKSIDNLNSFYVKDSQGNKMAATAKKMDGELYEVILKDGKTIKPDALYTVGADGFKEEKLRMRTILDAYYYEDDDLGLTYTEAESTFKVWAPTATAVKVVVYDDATTVEGTKVPMVKSASTGVWTATQAGNLNGKYYLYELTFADGKVNLSVDPYARSTSANGQKTAIIDLATTNPIGWEDDSKPSMMSETDAVIYELHVRDMSIDDSVAFQYPGKFKAFTETGLKTKGGHTAGIDHLKELGVTHVHLLPSYDFATVDETKVDDSNYDGRKFNWGYDPQNYNVPEGAYSTNPTDPTSRVTEFKEMVAALHEAGIRVVMDVVYNHTFDINNNPFGLTVPDYYYRTHDDSGEYANGSGCGNEVASERPMVRKFIVDSVGYWEDEYNVDGFRFDLMGLIDTTTMKEVSNTLKAKDPSILIYGEPWQAGGSVLPGSMQTVKGSQKGEQFAVFNDEIRGAIKGDSDAAGKGFATGAPGKEKDIVTGIKGSIDTIAQEPIEMINYVTAHDNLNMWDKVIKTQKLEASEGFLELKDGELVNGGSVEEAVANATPHSKVDVNDPLANDTVRMSILANGIALTSQGIPFIHAGDEMLRTKFGDHNSYKSPDAINMMRWDYKDKFKEVFEYYKGLIEVRKAHPAFKMDTDELVEKHLEVLSSEDNVVSFILKDYANGDMWKNIVVIYNANTKEKAVQLPHSANWKIVVNDKQAGNHAIQTLNNATSVTVAPLSMMILYDEMTTYEPIPTKIQLSTEMLGLEIGMEKTVTAKVIDQNGRLMPNAKVQWQVEDSHIATVKDGKITALAVGKTKVTASYEGISVSLVVEVVNKLIPTEIKLSLGKEFVYTGIPEQINVEVYDQFNQKMVKAPVIWSTLTSSIASVDQKGQITGLQAGKAVIKVQSGQISRQIEVLVKAYERRYIVFEYHRPDGNYDNWDVWVWNTGVKNDAIKFDHIEEDKAVAYIEIGPTTESIGFIIRKDNWEEKDPDGDRFIRVEENQVITKVKCESGQMAFETLEPSKMPQINPRDKEIFFTYRDNNLFKTDKMDTLKVAKVEINGELYDMTYNASQERFEYVHKGLKEGKYLYSYHIIDAEGTSKEVLDPYNLKTENNKSVLEYSLLDLNLVALLSHSKIDYNQNTVVELEITGETEKIAQIFVDLTAVGGEKVEMNKEMMALAIGVTDDTPIGMKTLPIEVIDTMNNVYTTEVELGVLPRVSRDDFDWDEAVIYFMLTDRFNNGNQANDDPYGIGYNQDDPGAYHGGDFAGITEKLDYLSELGINTIWITPVVENIGYDVRFNDDPHITPYYGYHGYWAKDFERLNPHLGTLEEFHTLIDKAHEEGIKIMVDVVLNHAGYGMEGTMENAPANYPTDEDREKFAGMIRTEQSSDEVIGQLAGLPDFKTEDPAVREKIINWQVAWVENFAKTSKGNTIDYFRVDTVKHVEDATWMAFKNELTKVMPEFKLIGEMWGASAEDDLGYLDAGKMDSVLDFNFKTLAMNFVNGNVEDTMNKLIAREEKLDNTSTVGNFLSSHDEDGFLYKLNGDQDKFKLAVSLQATAKGQPVIYYGEELGHSGQNNYPYYNNRYDMDWSKAHADNSILKHYQKVFGIREDYSKLFSKGSVISLGGSSIEGYMAFTKNYKNENAVVTLNLKEAPQEMTLKVPYAAGDYVKDLYTGKTYQVAKNQMLTYTVPSSKDGGTSIMVKKQNDNNHPNPTPNNPTTPSKEYPFDVFNQGTMNDMIEEELKKLEGGMGKIELTVKGTKNKNDEVGIVLPVDLIQGAKDKVSIIYIDLADTQIALPMTFFEALTKEEKVVVKNKVYPVGDMLKGEEWINLSQVNDIYISLMTKEGKEIPVTDFDTPIQIQIKLEKDALELVLDLRKVTSYYVDDEGKLINMGGIVEDNILKFETAHLSKYVALGNLVTFTDIQDHWAQEMIEVLASRGVIAGKGNDIYDPSGQTTRGEISVLLNSIFKFTSEDDVTAYNDMKDTDMWYSEAVKALEDKAIFPETIKETFRPQQNVTREEASYMFAQAYLVIHDIEEDIVPSTREQFKDDTLIADWAKESVYFNTDLGIISGKLDNQFDPKGYITRAEVATMVMKFLEVTNQIGIK